MVAARRVFGTASSRRLRNPEPRPTASGERGRTSRRRAGRGRPRGDAVARARGAAVAVGRVVAEHPRLVVIKTAISGTLVLTMPIGKQLPRIS